MMQQQQQKRWPTMAMVVMMVFIACTWLGNCATAATAAPTTTTTGTFHNEEIRRFTDLSTHIEDSVLHIRATNVGTEPTNRYVVIVPQSKITHLSFVEAIRSTSTSTATASAATLQRLYREDDKKNRMPVDQIDASSVTSDPVHAANYTFFAVTFPQPIAPSETASFFVFFTFTRTLTAYPVTKAQDDDQLVWYNDYRVVLSPYPTKSQRTEFRLASTHVEGWSKKNGALRGSTIEYGPFESTPAYSAQSIYIHFENNSPFITMTSMRKEIEVSHWGNVAITEWYKLLHTGATIVGQFSRMTYQARMDRSPGSFRMLTASLPAHANGIYYRDVIGNISTSHTRRARTETVLEVLPRFPMHGGWAADLEIGYNVPGSKNLFLRSDDSSVHVLVVPFGSMFASAAIDEAEIRVILPEGSFDIAWATPFDVDSQHMDKHLTHLDTSGRPVLVLKKSNVVKFHNQDIVVQYRFERSGLMREPMLVFGALLGMFALFMVYYRVELALGQETSAVSSSLKRAKME